MPEYIGYQIDDHIVSNPEMYRLNDEQKQYFAEKEIELGQNIRIRLVAGCMPAPNRDDLQYPGIVVYDAATNSRSEDPPSKMDKIAFSSGKLVLTKSPYYYEPVSREGKTEVFTRGAPGDNYGRRALGAVQHSAVYSAIAISNYPDKQMLGEAFDAAFLRAKDYVYWARAKSDYMDKLKREFADHIETQIESDIKEAERLIRERQRQIEQYNDEISGMFREISLKQREKTSRMQMLGSDKEQGREQIQKLSAFPDIDRIEASNYGLTVFTKPLYLYSPNREERVLLGSMKIEIEDERVNIKNLNNSKRGRPHPHVDEGGSPCWGASNQGMIELLADRNYVDAIEMILVYLSQYNPHDAYGEYGPYWFETEDLEIRSEDNMYVSKAQVEKQLLESAKENEVVVEIDPQTNRPTRILGRG